MKYKYLHFNENDTLNGIFAFLNQNYYYTLFEVHATTNPVVPGFPSPRAITQRNQSKSYQYWASDDQPEMTISFTHPILLTAYTFENAGSGHSLMVNWTIFGSNNNITWETIDERKGEVTCTPDYYEFGTETRFSCKERNNVTYAIENPKFFFHIKIRNDFNSGHQKYIIMRSLEFHGLASFFHLCTLIRKFYLSHLISSYIVILLL